MDEVKVKKSIFKRWWFWVIAVIISLGIIGNLSNKNDKTDTEKASVNSTTQNVSNKKAPESKPIVKPTEAPKKADYEILSHSAQKDEFGFLTITGKIKNNTGKKQSYVQVEINLFDKDGAQVGSTFANVNNLEANAIWIFKAMATEENVASYKIIKVTGF